MSRFSGIRRLFGLGQQEKERNRRRKQRVDAPPGTRVLIIDDSRTVVAALGHMLKQAGYEVAGAGDAETGLEMVAANPPELIFLDIVLPGMNGFAALRKLRRNPATENIPVIMISGNVQATERFYLMRIGADGFIKKPFGRAEVFANIEALIRAGRLPERENLDTTDDQTRPDNAADLVVSDDASFEEAGSDSRAS
ncbi:MAG: hypothetical protein Kow0020_12210 [Wenzhouxiangellaceae bacterium]